MEIKLKRLYLDKYGIWVSENGVIQKPCGANVRHTKDRHGYPRVYVMVSGRRKGLFVHRMIAEAFIPNPENKPEVNHINADKGDYSIENLEWCTREENMKHAHRNGLVPPRKMTETERCRYSMAPILYDTGRFSMREIALAFGTTQPNITRMIKRHKGLA
jgi:hypothetical protein